MNSPTICLNLIVKNEAAVIGRCLASVKRHIDAYAIVDTGSTDGTQEIIRRELAGIPGTVADMPWRGFAGSRNDALDIARKSGADYFLTLDADEVLVWPDTTSMADKLVDDVYGIRFRLADGGDSTWQRVILGRLSLPWRWEGDVHEHLECTPHEPTKTLITGAFVDSYTDGGRSRSRKYSVIEHLPPNSQIAWATEKYQRDVLTLEGMSDADPNDPRAVFYLAQSYCGARRIDDAILTYEKRAKMGGFDEEVYYSLFQIAGLKEARGDDWAEVARAHMAAYEFRPTRAEPLWALAVMHNDRGMPSIAEIYARRAAEMLRPRDCLLVMESVYEWRAKDELAAALGRLRRYDEALVILEELIASKKLPDMERDRAVGNIDFIRDLKREAQAA